MKPFAIAIFSLALLAAGPSVAQSGSAVVGSSQIQLVSLHGIHRIYVGSMGQSDEAERFRMLLQDELGRAGFLTADSEQDADAILTGALAVRVYADESLARATVVLKDRGGARLWSNDFQPRFHFGGKDTVKLRAQDVAKALKKACANSK